MTPSKTQLGFLSLAGLWVSISVAGRPGDADAQTTFRIDPGNPLEEIVGKAAFVTPSPRQVAWQEIEFAAFIHFGMNTFTDREWGDGKESPGLFNPTELDARQWVSTVKAAGMKMLILTAKHHDGFCLWPSKYTEHSVKNSPWRGGKGDVVREVARACRSAGLKFGLYVSPWDRHEPAYGDSPAYNEHFKNQLRELLTGYGEVADVWFDGAIGEGPNGKRQIYDWPGYWQVIRELQPKATISIMGPDVRWCGNEAGISRPGEWSVVPMLRPPSEVASGRVGGLNPQARDLGSRRALLEAAKQGARLVWYPAQVDTSIRPGWFFHAAENDKVRPLDQLLDIYYGAVGGNCQLLLNIPPDKRGRIHENDVQRLRELGEVLNATFARNLARGARTAATNARGREYTAAKTVDHDRSTFWCPEDGVTAAGIEYELRAPGRFNVALLQEHIQTGQRIEEVALDSWDGSGWQEISRAATVGYKRLLRFPEVDTAKVRVRIISSRVCPTLAEFGLYRAPAGEMRRLPGVPDRSFEPQAGSRKQR